MTSKTETIEVATETPTEAAERWRKAAAARERKLAADAEKARIKLEAERAYRAEWHASSKARILCSVCRKGPFDGSALYRRGDLFCEEHAPSAVVKAAKPSKKAA
jgi:hypothetical protein